MPDTSAEIVAQARAAGMTRALAMVSAGKDSVALVATLRRLEVDAFYLSKFLVPGLEVEEEVFTALESRYNIKIHRVASPRRLSMLASDTLCMRNVWGAIPARSSPQSAAFDRWAARVARTDWMCTGIRTSDSVNRRFAIMRYGNPNLKLKRFFPVAEWTRKEVLAFIAQQKLPLSSIYSVNRISIDAINLEHCYALRKLNPRDWRRICDDFPLMDALAWLYDRRVSDGAAVPPIKEI